MNKTTVWAEDIDRVAREAFIPWERLRGQTVLVTGATGLIGSALVRTLLQAEKNHGLGLRVKAMTRDADKARHRFADIPERDSVLTIHTAATGADYIVHGAGPTSGRFFAEHPGETMRVIRDGTQTLLDFARECGAKGFVFLSSMEVYGDHSTGEGLTEEAPCVLDPENPRSSYPLAKLAAEALCRDYADQYGLHANSIRLAQTFGAGLPEDDPRVVAEFFGCALDGKPIVLKTRGESRRAYLYTADAVSAILTVLLKGEAGAVYNAANSQTYGSIYELACAIAKTVSAPPVPVLRPVEDTGHACYPKPSCWNPDVNRLCLLGWMPLCDRETMLNRTVRSLRERE